MEVDDTNRGKESQKTPYADARLDEMDKNSSIADQIINKLEEEKENKTKTPTPKTKPITFDQIYTESILKSI